MDGGSFPSDGDLEARPATLRPDRPDDDQEAARRALAIVAQLQPTFAVRDQTYEMIDRVVFMMNHPDVPKNYRKTTIEVQNPLALHITNQITAALSINTPKVHFDPIKIGDAGHENKQLRQRFFEASWQRQQREARRPLDRLFTHAVVTKGEGILKVVERTKQAWSGYNAFSKKTRAELDADERLDDDARDRLYDARTEEKKRGLAYPISATDVPPETFYYVKGEDGFTICAEVKEVPYYDALVRYGAGLDGKGRIVQSEALGLPRAQWQQGMSGVPMLRMVEVWDWEYVTYVLQGPGEMPSYRVSAKRHDNDVPFRTMKEPGAGVTVKRIRHRYGNRDTKTLIGPYFHAHGITTSSRQPELQGLGVLHGYLSLFPALDSMLTIQTNGAYMTGFPTYKRTSQPTLGLPDGGLGIDASEAEAGEVRIVPGDILPWDISPIEQPRAGADLKETIAMFRQLIELALPSVAQGVVSGEMAGYAINQAAYLASLAWDPIISNIEQAHSDRVGFESRLIEEQIKEPVYVHATTRKSNPTGARKRQAQGWLKLGPTDLGGAHLYECELEPKTPSNKTVEIRSHGELLDKGLETWAQAVEGVGNDPVEVKRGRLIEAIEGDQEIMAIFKQRVMKELATLDQTALEAGKTDAPGAPPPPNTMPEGAPPAMTPEQMMAAMQAEQGAAAPGAPPPGMSGPPVAPEPMLPPGTVPGQPGGVRGPPQRHAPLPGE